jgi:hypothetical protein
VITAGILMLRACSWVLGAIATWCLCLALPSAKLNNISTVHSGFEAVRHVWPAFRHGEFVPRTAAVPAWVHRGLLAVQCTSPGAVLFLVLRNCWHHTIVVLSLSSICEHHSIATRLRVHAGIEWRMLLSWSV